MEATEKKTNPELMEHEVDLLQYLFALLNAKYRILMLAFMVSISVFAYSKLIDDLYTSAALLAVNINDAPGGVQKGNYRGSDVLGLIEHDFVIDATADNEIDRLVAKMTSTPFVDLFIRENYLEKYIFSEFWNSESEEWIPDFEPNLEEATAFFRQNMVNVSLDGTTGLLVITITSKNPVLSAELANKYWKRFNLYVRQNESAELLRRKDYLDGKLKETSNLELQRSIFRLIETQYAAEALLFGRDQYPLEEIQLALPPPVKSSPRRKVWAVLAFIGTAVVSVVFVLGMVVLRNIKKALKPYQIGQNQIENTEIGKPSENILDPESRSKRRKPKDIKPETIPKQSDDDLSQWLD